MAARSYFQSAQDALQTVYETQGGVILRAADLICDAICSGNSVFSFGAGHSFILTEEMVYRTGGLMLINPIYPHGMNLSVRPATLTSEVERIVGLGSTLLAASPARANDVLLIASTSGRNAVGIDMALAAKQTGISTICITSKAYSAAVESRHPSGKKLGDICDLVIDNCAPVGDAAVEVAGLEQSVGPISTVTGCAIVNAIVVEVVEALIRRGVDPPVFMSANVDGGDAHNARLLAENRHRIFYLA